MWLTVSYLALQSNGEKIKGPCMDVDLILGWPSLGSLWLLLNNNNGADWERATHNSRKIKINPFVCVYFLIFKLLLLQLLVLHAWFECRGKQHEEQEDYHFIVEKIFWVVVLCFFFNEANHKPQKVWAPILFFFYYLRPKEKKFGNSRVEWMKKFYHQMAAVSCSVELHRSSSTQSEWNFDRKT